MTTVGRTLPPPENSFFLFGPRGTGKTTWLNSHYRKAPRFDLLSSRTFLDFSRDPSLLEARIGNQPKGTLILIDEIQKLPILLDEVHRLMEEKKFCFGLTGSSARKLKRTGANLLAGRAVTRNMFPFTSVEWPRKFDIKQALEWGCLPMAVQSKNPGDFLQSYFYTYLKEEIQEEGLVRQIDPFVRFLEVASLLNGQVLNIESIARETGVKRVTLDKWFLILEDTLFAYRLPGWQPKIKVRERTHSKLYWFDTGVARAAAGLLNDTVDRSWLGWAFETWLLHEMRAYNSYFQKNRSLFYYALPSQVDIDFIIETKKPVHSTPGEVIGVEVKLSKKWKREWESPLRDLASSHQVKVKKMIGVYTGDDKLTYGDFQVWPYQYFLSQLHSGKLF